MIWQSYELVKAHVIMRSGGISVTGKVNNSIIHIACAIPNKYICNRFQQFISSSTKQNFVKASVSA